MKAETVFFLKNADEVFELYRMLYGYLTNSIFPLMVTQLLGEVAAIVSTIAGRMTVQHYTSFLWEDL